MYEICIFKYKDRICYISIVSVYSYNNSVSLWAMKKNWKNRLKLLLFHNLTHTTNKLRRQKRNSLEMPQGNWGLSSVFHPEMGGWKAKCWVDRISRNTWRETGKGGLGGGCHRLEGAQISTASRDIVWQAHEMQMFIYAK